jgi:hypothetical protein
MQGQFGPFEGEGWERTLVSPTPSSVVPLSLSSVVVLKEASQLPLLVLVQVPF